MLQVETEEESGESFYQKLSKQIKLFDEKLATFNDYNGFYNTLGKYMEILPSNFNFWKFYIRAFIEHLRKAPTVSFAGWNLYFISNVPKLNLPTPSELIEYTKPYLGNYKLDFKFYKLTTNLYLSEKSRSHNLTEEEQINLANATLILAMFIQFLYCDDEVLKLFPDEDHLFAHICQIIIHHKENTNATTYATLAILGAFRVNNLVDRAHKSAALERIKSRSNLRCFLKVLAHPSGKEIVFEKGEMIKEEKDAKLILGSIIAKRTMQAFNPNLKKTDDLSYEMWIFGSDHWNGWSNHQNRTPIDHASGHKFYFEVFHCCLGSLRVGIAHKPTEKNLANWFDLAAFKNSITFDAFEKIHWVYGKERTCSALNRPDKEGYLVGVTIDTTARSALELIKFTVNGQPVESDPPVSTSRAQRYLSNKKRKTAPIWHQPYYITFATSALQSCIVLKKKDSWTYAPQNEQLTELGYCEFVRIQSNLCPRPVKVPPAPAEPEQNATVQIAEQAEDIRPSTSQVLHSVELVEDAQVSESPEVPTSIEPSASLQQYHLILSHSEQALQLQVEPGHSSSVNSADPFLSSAQINDDEQVFAGAHLQESTFPLGDGNENHISLTTIDTTSISFTGSPSTVSSAQSESLLQSMDSSMVSQSPPFLSGEHLLPISPSCSSPGISSFMENQNSFLSTSPQMSLGDELFSNDLQIPKTLQPDSPLPPVQHLQQIQQQANYNQLINQSREENVQYIQSLDGFQILTGINSLNSRQIQLPVNCRILSGDSTSTQDESVCFVDLQSKEPLTFADITDFTLGVPKFLMCPMSGFIQTEHGILQ